MKYVVILLLWIVLLTLLTLLKISVVVKFLPYILIVTFGALIIATWNVIKEDVTLKEIKNEQKDD